MISMWERKLHTSSKVITEDYVMNLESILSSINVCEHKFRLNDEYSTIRYITAQEYDDDVYKYTQPNFIECRSNSAFRPKFLLFSAPGATGKTALAKHICYMKKGIFWDLPDNKVAEYSFNGAVAKAVGYDHMSDFLQSLVDGENFFVIDAFDEAEAGSGRTGIEFFLRDLNELTGKCENICAILMARTESAIFIKNYFNTHEIHYKHFEVGFFAEYNAKEYIKNSLAKLRINVTDIVNKCIDEQFREIKRILMNDAAAAESFLGYAPVLNALAASYDEERNTLNLLKSTSNTDNSFALMKKIFDDLLARERDKFTKALSIRIPQISAFSKEVYDADEQILRLFGMILFQDSDLFVKMDESISIEYHEEYLETIAIQLRQHPFILSKEHGGDTYYDFSGTAFRDFVIAYCLSSDDACDFVDDYLSENYKYCPSQMLIEFYNLFSDHSLKGKHIPLMYNSFKAHAQLEDEIFIHINGNKNDCSVEFNLQKGDAAALKIEFNIIDLEEGIYVNQLSNCYIDVDAKVYVGNIAGEARINNSAINCTEIVWCSEHVSIEAYSPGVCEITVQKFSNQTNTIPKFEIKTDDKRNLRVFCPLMNGYYKLMAHKCDEWLEEENNEFSFFANLLRRIFSCLRSHSKDTPARKMDFIDNRVISTNERKKDILAFLLDEHVLYTDEQAWLYKLDTEKLSDFSINWNEIRDGNYSSLSRLFEKFKKTI